MTTIVATGEMAVSLFFVALLVFFILARGVREDDDYEIEVKLFPPTIRRRVKRNDRRHLDAEAVQSSMTFETGESNEQVIREIAESEDGLHLLRLGDTGRPEVDV